MLLLLYKCVFLPFHCAVVMVCLLRYAQVIEHSHHCWVNTSALVSGCTNALGLVMVGNFQVKVQHQMHWHNVNTLNSIIDEGLLLFWLVQITCVTPLFCLTGWSCQICALCGCWSGFSSRAAVCVPAVCAHLPGGCDHARLLDGPFPSGSGTGSYGLTCPQYPLKPPRCWHTVVILYFNIQ